VAILHDGQIVECNSVDRVFLSPQHAYTKQLISAIPQLPVAETTASFGRVPVGN
jgi:peptide/nickel transport system ATP-binding protein